MEKTKLNICGKITDLYQFDPRAEITCDGSKTCAVACPGELKPSRDTLTCLNPKRLKMSPPKVQISKYTPLRYL